MRQFFKNFWLHYTKKAYVKGALSIQSAMCNKLKVITIEVNKTDGSKEIITYKLAK